MPAPNFHDKMGLIKRFAVINCDPEINDTQIEGTSAAGSQAFMDETLSAMIHQSYLGHFHCDSGSAVAPRHLVDYFSERGHCVSQRSHHDVGRKIGYSG